MSVSVEDDAEVMASVDDDGETERLVIADISREEAWLSMCVTDATSLSDWR